jgi:hypothetical protein
MLSQKQQQILEGGKLSSKKLRGENVQWRNFSSDA